MNIYEVSLNRNLLIYQVSVRLDYDKCLDVSVQTNSSVHKLSKVPTDCYKFWINISINCRKLEEEPHLPERCSKI